MAITDQAALPTTMQVSNSGAETKNCLVAGNHEREGPPLLEGGAAAVLMVAVCIWGAAGREASTSL